MAMMTGKKVLFATMTVSLLMSGCSSQSRRFESLTSSWWKCATAGGIVGGAGGALDDGRAAAYGALGGAVLGGLICAIVEKEDGTGADTRPSEKPAVECEHYVPGWDVASYGCPMDTDYDGVPDPMDQCPNTPAGSHVDENGCVVVQQEVYLEPIQFALSSAELSEKAREQLNEMAYTIKQYPSSEVVITGYTDTTGPVEFNRALSKRRAQSVQDYLEARGVRSSRIEVYGDGPEDPIASNATRPGREMNRRVQIELRQTTVTSPM